MNRPFKIWVEDRETLNKVLAKMEKEGIKWWMSKTNPTNIISLDIPIALFVDEDNLLSHAGRFEYYELHDNDEVTPEEYLKESKEMTKSDLMNWMVVETRDGSMYLIDRVHESLVRYCGWLPLGYYTDDLLIEKEHHAEDYDIMKVYTIKNDYAVRFFLYKPSEEDCKDYLQLIWSRDEKPVEMTISEIEEKLGIKNLKITKEKE